MRALLRRGWDLVPLGSFGCFSPKEAAGLGVKKGVDRSCVSSGAGGQLGGQEGACPEVAARPLPPTPAVWPLWRRLPRGTPVRHTPGHGQVAVC